jgi:hypothetical protein
MNGGRHTLAKFAAPGYMPKDIAPALFAKAHILTEKLETAFFELKRSVPKKSSARPKGLRWDILALTPEGNVQFQAGGVPYSVPSGSLVATVSTCVRKSSDIIFNGDKSFIALHRNGRFPRAVVTAQVYKWILGGDYIGVYDGLTLPQLEETLRIMKAEGLQVPLKHSLAARLKAATAESLRQRVVVVPTVPQRS